MLLAWPTVTHGVPRGGAAAEIESGPGRASSHALAVAVVGRCAVPPRAEVPPPNAFLSTFFSSLVRRLSAFSSARRRLEAVSPIRFANPGEEVSESAAPREQIAWARETIESSGALKSE